MTLLGAFASASIALSVIMTRNPPNHKIAAQGKDLEDVHNKNGFRTGDLINTNITWSIFR
jgi:hypothetical protein